MKQSRKVLLITVTIICVSLGLAIVWKSWGRDQLYAAKISFLHSSVARSLRCRGVSRPFLARGDTEWTLNYSWVGGFGVGDVWFSVDRNGKAVLRTYPSGGKETSDTFSLSPEQAMRIATAVDDSSLLCLNARPRDGYVVEDLGRYQIQVTTSNYSKAVYVDRCVNTEDDRALQQVLDQIASLHKVLGPSITWGPEGLFSHSGSCADEASTRASAMSAFRN